MEDLFARGIEEFNKGLYFEAHDLWEELWRESTGPERTFYQGLIHIAVGLYHLSNGNSKGACSQFNKGLAKVEMYVPAYQGINTESLVAGVRCCLADASRINSTRATTIDEANFPLIEWIS